MQVAISDPVLARAVSHTISELPPSIRRESATIGDDKAVRPDVLVIEPRPLTCQRALDCIATGSVRAVITTNALEQLENALRAVAQDAVFLPKIVIDQAKRLPCLSEREIDILRGVLAGYPSASLALIVGVSERTLKRMIADLMTRLSAADRAGLAMAALELGVRPNGLASHSAS
jgi:DNA-binding NarL/FixJ family response regulator